MAYTPIDLTIVMAAIIALTTGERVVSVKAGNRTVQFALTEKNVTKWIEEKEKEFPVLSLDSSQGHQPIAVSPP